MTGSGYDPGNIFAKILRGEAPAHRVFEDEHSLAILDVMPQSDGHTLVLPKVPARDLFDLPPEALNAVMATTRRVAQGLQEAFRPDGLTLTQYNGAAAGQTVFHFHMHVIPRWADRPLRGHGRGFADPARLEEQAKRLRGVLAAS